MQAPTLTRRRVAAFVYLVSDNLTDAPLMWGLHDILASTYNLSAATASLALLDDLSFPGLVRPPPLWNPLMSAPSVPSYPGLSLAPMALSPPAHAVSAGSFYQPAHLAISPPTTLGTDVSTPSFMPTSLAWHNLPGPLHTPPVVGSASSTGSTTHRSTPLHSSPSSSPSTSTSSARVRRSSAARHRPYLPSSPEGLLGRHSTSHYSGLPLAVRPNSAFHAISPAPVLSSFTRDPLLPQGSFQLTSQPNPSVAPASPSASPSSGSDDDPSR